MKCVRLQLFLKQQPLCGLKDSTAAEKKTHYSLTKALISAFFFILCISFFPTEQRGNTSACGEMSREDYMYVLTCKSTPVLVKDGSYSLFCLDGRRAPTAPCLGLSHGYWVSQLKLCALRSHGNPLSNLFSFPL